MDRKQVETNLTELGRKPSSSEDKGLELLGNKAQKILSLGVSSGGFAEIQMAWLNPASKIVATTIDSTGAEGVKKNVALLGLTEQIEVKIEDVTKDWPYTGNEFDFIYARLILHYLTNADMQAALKRIHTALKPGGTLFIVVHSDKSPKKYPGYKQASFDAETGYTSVPFYDRDGKTVVDKYTRRFYAPDELSQLLVDSGFAVKEVHELDELLYRDFMRTKPAQFGPDTLIWLVAQK